jgi:hypothetical protein
MAIVFLSHLFIFIFTWKLFHFLTTKPDIIQSKSPRVLPSILCIDERKERESESFVTNSDGLYDITISAAMKIGATKKDSFQTMGDVPNLLTESPHWTNRTFIPGTILDNDDNLFVTVSDSMDSPTSSPLLPDSIASHHMSSPRRKKLKHYNHNDNNSYSNGCYSGPTIRTCGTF